MSDKKRQARKQRRQSILIYSVLAAAVAAALFFLLRPQSDIRLVNGALTGVGENQIVLKLNGSYQAVGNVIPPKGYHAIQQSEQNATETEYYFAPDDESSPVRYLYYAPAAGQAQKLASVAHSAYGSYYQAYVPTEVVTEEIAGRETTWFSFTCTLNGEQEGGPYQQSLLSYYPAKGGEACVFSIVSLRSPTPDYQQGEALKTLLQLAADGVSVE